MGTIRLDASKILASLTEKQTKAQIAIKMLAQQGAIKFQNYARTNRPWTDRTGRAKQTLTGYVETSPNNTKIIIAHGVDYGKWLELANERKYAICEPTVRAMSGEVLESFDMLLKLMR